MCAQAVEWQGHDIQGVTRTLSRAETGGLLQNGSHLKYSDSNITITSS